MDEEAITSRTRVLAAIVAAMAVVGLAHARPQPAPDVPERRTSEPAPALAARALREGQRVDLNRADGPTLELLPGIGPALAGRILRSRQERGPYASVGDLARVRGIGPRRIEALQPLVYVEPALPEAAAGVAPAEDAGQGALAPTVHGD